LEWTNIRTIISQAPDEIWENTKHLHEKKIKNIGQLNKINCTTEKFRIKDVSSDKDHRQRE